MNLLSIQRLGRNRENARLWIESQHLNRLGFPHGTPFSVESLGESLVLRPAILAENHISSRMVDGGRRPIIDLANQSLLAGLSEFSELKILASFERIRVTPSERAFAIHRNRSLHPPFRVLELFAGGGTMTAALGANPHFTITAGVEVEPAFADEWRHSEALLIQSDLRSLQVKELPEFDVLMGGIPCTSHSNLGRAKKNLGGKPELGDTGDLFLPVVTIISERMPAAVLLENVPAFGSSLAGQLLVSHLRRIGYHTAVQVLQPNLEWGEIEDRRRWVLIATLDREFTLKIPGTKCTRTVSEYLDAPEEGRDREDAARIARTIAGLRVHNARHRAAGHGFEFTVVDGSETRLPVIPRSYHKINSGPFVQTPFGPRLLRQSEMERIHGTSLTTQHYSTAVQILGQGVQTCVFRNIFSQLSAHLWPHASSQCS